MIEINQLKKYYDKKLALTIDALSIEENHVLGLVGTNGSGKSTLLRLIAGVLDQEEGEIAIDGVSVKAHPKCKRELLYISDDPIDHVNTSIDSLFEFYSVFYGMKRQAFYDRLDFFEIPRRGNLSKFSKGMRRRAYLAVALAVEPKILLLDEAFDGLDPRGKRDFILALNELLERKDMTVIVASHSIREIEDLCDSYLMLQKGEVLVYAPEGLDGKDYMKITVAFKEGFDFMRLASPKATLVSHLDKIGTLYFTGTQEEAEAYIAPFAPAVAEFAPLSAEEYFIMMTEEKKA
ncbi:MAG: ATP-binding cassette domain-containing protein [Christensenellaceae bacterium]